VGSALAFAALATPRGAFRYSARAAGARRDSGCLRYFPPPDTCLHIYAYGGFADIGIAGLTATASFMQVVWRHGCGRSALDGRVYRRRS